MENNTHLERDENLDINEILTGLNKPKEKINVSENEKAHIGYLVNKNLAESTKKDITLNDKSLSEIGVSTNDMDIKFKEHIDKIMEIYNDFDNLRDINDEDKGADINFIKNTLNKASNEQVNYTNSINTIESIKKTFAKYDFAKNGLAKKGSPEAQDYAIKRKLLAEGKFKLPKTVEESEELLDKSMRGEIIIKPEVKDIKVNKTNVVPEKVEEIKVSPNKPSLVETNLQSRLINNKVKLKTSQELIDERNGKNKLLNPMENLSRVSNSEGYVDSKNPSVVQFNVDNDNVTEFLNNMPYDDKKVIKTSNTLIVNTIETKDIPIATKTIDSLDEYKKLSKSGIDLETKEVALVNSGYVATVKRAGSLAIASLAPIRNDIDINDLVYKQCKFCYDYLVSTSIGDLSFDDFAARTSPVDLSIMILNILQLSYPDEDKMMRTCDNTHINTLGETVQCNGILTMPFRLSSLLDESSHTDKMKEKCSEIVNNRRIIEDSMRVHNESDVIKVRNVQINKTTIIHVKLPSCIDVISKSPNLEKISEVYNDAVSLLLLYVQSVTKLFKAEGSDNLEPYLITDLTIIADTLNDLHEDELQALNKIINGLETYDIKFSIKGKFTCPKCGKVIENPETNILDLVFFKRMKMMGVN